MSDGPHSRCNGLCEAVKRNMGVSFELEASGNGGKDSSLKRRRGAEARGCCRAEKTRGVEATFDESFCRGRGIGDDRV